MIITQPNRLLSRDPLDGGFSQPFWIADLSGGKDSTAMLLLLLEKGCPIDAVIWADVEMDFPEMREHIAKLDRYLFQKRGLHITTVKHPKGFEYLMFDQPLKSKRAIEKRLNSGLPTKGYGWPRACMRWCTGKLKVDLMEREAKRLGAGRTCIHYVGIAVDEPRRCKPDPHKRYPLAEWGITEQEALQICYDRGFDMGGLYKIYRRASCWCCPMARINELRQMRKYHPALWNRLREMDERARAQFGVNPLGQFKQNWSVARLEERFAKEDEEHT